MAGLGAVSLNMFWNPAIQGSTFLQASMKGINSYATKLNKANILGKTNFSLLNRNLKSLENHLGKIRSQSAKITANPIRLDIKSSRNSLKEARKDMTAIAQEARTARNYTRLSADDMARGARKKIRGRVKSRVKLAGGVAVGSAVGALASLNPIRNAIDFETAMADVVKATDATDAQRDLLKSNILKQLNTGSILTGTQIAQIQAGGGRSGVSLQALPQFTKDISKASVALDFSTEEAGVKFAKMAERLDLPISKINIMTNAFTHLENNGANFGKDMVNTTGRLAGIFKELKFSPQNSAAISNYMNTLEVSPELAATSFKILNNRFKKTNSKFGYFTRLQKNGAGELKNIILDITKSMSKQQIMKTFGAQGSNVITKMSGDLKNLDKSLKLVSGNEFMKAVDKEYSVKMSTTGAKETMSKNRIEGGSIILGDQIKNQYTDFLNFLSMGILKVSLFYKQNKIFVHSIAAIGVKIAGVGLALKGIGAIVGMGRVLGLLNPIGIAITAIAGAGYLIYENWDFLKQKAGDIWTSIVNAMKSPLDSFFKWVDGKFKTVLGVYKELKASLGLTDGIGLETNKTVKKRQEQKNVGLALRTTPINNVNFDSSNKVGLKLPKSFSLAEKLNMQSVDVKSPSLIAQEEMNKSQVTNNNMQQTHQTFNNTINVQSQNGQVDIVDLEAKLNQIQRASAHTDEDITLADMAS